MTVTTPTGPYQGAPSDYSSFDGLQIGAGWEDPVTEKEFAYRLKAGLGTLGVGGQSNYQSRSVGALLASTALARANWEDSTSSSFTENWADFTTNGWVQPATPGLQVSGGKVYSTGTGGGASGANKAISLGANDKYRAVFLVDLATQAGSGGLMVGVSKDAPGAAPASGGGNAFALYLTGSSVPQVMNTGVATPLTGQVMAFSTRYICTVSVDATSISVTAVNTADNTEIRAQVLRSAFGSVNNLFIYNSDARGLTGYAIAPCSGRKAIASMASPATFEVNQRIHWSNDGTNGFELWLPAGYDSRKPLKLCMAFHGNGADETQWSTGNGGAIKNAMVAAGYAFLGAANESAKSTWGSQPGLNAYIAAYNWVKSLYPIGSVVFFLNSMGGIEGELTLASGKIPGVLAVAATSPTASLLNNYTGGGGMFTNTINTAYGIASDGSNYAAQTAGHDPLLMPPSAFRGVPFLLIYASDDTTVDPVANSQAFAASVGTASSVTTVATTGGHSFNPTPFLSQITAFFDAAQ